jgi:hypothetical protein
VSVTVKPETNKKQEFYRNVKSYTKASSANSPPTIEVNIPKTHQAFCKKRGKHQPHKVTRTRRARILCTPWEGGVMIGSRVAVVHRLS